MRERVLKDPTAQALLEARARSMRFEPTESEQGFWCAVRAQLLGVRFVRQVPLAGYIVDFLAPSAKLVVEINGGYHALRRRADARRDRVLQRLGYRVLRVDAEQVRLDIAGVLSRVRDALDE